MDCEIGRWLSTVAPFWWSLLQYTVKVSEGESPTSDQTLLISYAKPQRRFEIFGKVSIGLRATVRERIVCSLNGRYKQKIEECTHKVLHSTTLIASRMSTITPVLGAAGFAKWIYSSLLVIIEGGSALLKSNSFLWQVLLLFLLLYFQENTHE